MRLSRYEVLSETDLSRIHESSLRLLSETGMVVGSAPVLRLLSDFGAKVDFNKKRVRIPPDMVENALESLPSRIPLCDRNKKPALTLGDGTSHFASGHNAIYLLDTDTGERRTVTKADVATFARLSDALDNIHLVGVQAMPQDVVPQATLLHAVEAVFNNTEKHLYFSPENEEVTAKVFEMARTVIQDNDLSKTPILTCQLSSTSPLTWETGAVDAVIETAKAGVPLVLLPEPYAGVTAPLTLAGMLTVHNTEILSGIVFSQLVRKGTPVIYGSAWTTFDMKEANVVGGSPEGAIMRIAGAQLANHYKMPSHTTGPDSDSHCLDQQNGWEKTLTLVSAFGSGVDLIVNAGMFAVGMTVSFEQLVLDNEMAGMLYRFLGGVEVSPDTVALETIEKVGPRGNFLTEPHTLRYLRSEEHWQPTLCNRSIYENWRKRGAPTLAKKARERVEEILSSHQPAKLSQKVREELKRAIDNFEERKGS